MDSLVANYASSDEEEESKQQQLQPVEELDYTSCSNPKTSSFLSSLPTPKSSSSSSLFLSLPTPKSNLPNSLSSNPENQYQVDVEPSSLFSSLPQPNTQKSAPQPILPNPSSSLDRKPKKVVQFRPPINPSSLIKSKDADDEEDDDEEEEKRRKKSKDLEFMTQTSSVKSFLSSIPAPKNSGALGALASSSSGSGRRSILEADVTAAPDLNDVNTVSEPSFNSNVENTVSEPSFSSNVEAFGGDPSNWGSATENYSVNYDDSYVGYGNGAGGDPSNFGSAVTEDYPNYDNSYYGSYGDYGHYESKWVDRSSETVAPEMSAAENVVRFPGKRGRNDVPTEIIEVKQDELIKNRPREDQVKLTGIAFGPSYQPVSTKGKPTKLHKRKHQIGSLYFDMRQREMELAERRSKGFLTKAETQAKYGW